LAGVVYTLSPLTVVAGLTFAALVHVATWRADPDERRWLYVILGLAIGLRVAAIAALFVTTNHARVPYGFFFGDEDLFIRRSLWTRNLALGIPVHGADIVYAYDAVGESIYVYVVALLHVLFGPVTYGPHLVNATLFVGGAVLLYRIVRPRFGRPASLLGLALLMFLPSLFIWSISALKEPLFFALMTVGVWAALVTVRAPSWRRRVAPLLLLVTVVYLVHGVRDGGLEMAGGGIGGGLLLATVVGRPRLAVAVLIAALLVVPVALTRKKVQDVVVHNVREAAKLHWGHIITRGYVYKLLSPRLYEDRDASNTMTIHEGARFIAGAFISYVTVPAPWQLQSRAMALFWPEQSVWYGIALLVPFGVIVGLKRDMRLTCVLGMTALAAIAAVAPTSGNIGTLVRHRGLAMPYLVWFSTVGACDLLFRSRSHAHGDD
jgi:hypothetical protein